jgi:4-amino-4-deoxy-L-arabinose transferase-like glycosyltransferase
MATPGTRSRWVIPLRSILTGFSIFFLGSLSDVWLQQHAGSPLIAIMDDALVGVGVGLVVLFYERRQRQNIIRKLEVIRMMNHHVRNSLQVISFATSVPQQEEVTRKVRDAVERIEWALREVLPGQREDINDLLFHSHAACPLTSRRLLLNGTRSRVRHGAKEGLRIIPFS